MDLATRSLAVLTTTNARIFPIAVLHTRPTWRYWLKSLAIPHSRLQNSLLHFSAPTPMRSLSRSPRTNYWKCFLRNAPTTNGIEFFDLLFDILFHPLELIGTFIQEDAHLMRVTNSWRSAHRLDEACQFFASHFQLLVL